MKTRLLALIIAALCILPGCANQTTAQRIATGEQIFAVALDAYSATNGGKTITPEAVSRIGNELFAVAQGTQANVGSTPAQANLAQFTTLPVLGSNVQGVLPNAPITQAQVQQVYDAAALAVNSAP